jgi:subtilisin family serine protease
MGLISRFARRHGCPLQFERLEGRLTLSAAGAPRSAQTARLIDQEMTIPSWIAPSEVNSVRRAIEAITNGDGVDRAGGKVALADGEARQLVRLDDADVLLDTEGFHGEGYAIVIIDTGFDLDHDYFGPDVENNATGQPGADGIADRIVYQHDFYHGDNDASGVVTNPPLNTNHHGTHVATIAAGCKPGVFS